MAPLDPDDPILQAYDRGGLSAVVQVIAGCADGDLGTARAEYEARRAIFEQRETLWLQQQEALKPKPPPGTPPRTQESFAREAAQRVAWAGHRLDERVHEDHERAQIDQGMDREAPAPEGPGAPEQALSRDGPGDGGAQDPVFQGFERHGLLGAADAIRELGGDDPAATREIADRYRAGLHQAELLRLQEQAAIADPARSQASIEQEARHNIAGFEDTIARQAQQDHDRGVLKDAGVPVHWESYGAVPGHPDNHIARDGQGKTVLHIYPTDETGPVNEQTRYTLHTWAFGEKSEQTSTHNLALDDAMQRGQEHINGYRHDAREHMREKLLKDFRDAVGPSPPPPPGSAPVRPEGPTPPPPNRRDRDGGGAPREGPPPPPPPGGGAAERPPQAEETRGQRMVREMRERDAQARGQQTERSSTERSEAREGETRGQRMVREMREREAQQRSRGGVTR